MAGLAFLLRQLLERCGLAQPVEVGVGPVVLQAGEVLDSSRGGGGREPQFFARFNNLELPLNTYDVYRTPASGNGQTNLTNDVTSAFAIGWR